MEPVIDIDKDTLLYMDTDSLFLTEQLDPKYLDNSKLGKFKQEYYPDGGIFISAKNYILFPSTIKMKGVNIKNVTKEHYFELLEKGQTFIKSTQSLKTFGKVIIDMTTKQINNLYNKRYLGNFYTYPHKDATDFLNYFKLNNEKKVKSQYKKCNPRPMMRLRNNVIEQIYDYNNYPIVLPHLPQYDNYRTDTYLRYRLMGVTLSKFTEEEKLFLYNKIYQIDNPNMKSILSELSIKDMEFDENSLDKWESLSYLQKWFFNLQKDYLV
jgi:hypothetical protein